MDRVRLWGCLIVLVMILIPSQSNADVPMLINYRGYVDVSDPVIGLPTGALTVDMAFSLFDTIQIAGVTPLWTETQTVQLLDGNFAVILGSVSPLSLDLFASSQRYLSVSIGAVEVVSPQLILSVPYAMQAGNVYSDPAGKVGIGTTNPATDLDVQGTLAVSSKLGVGTTSPSADLQVEGNAKVDGNLTVMHSQNALKVWSSYQIPAHIQGSNACIVIIQGATGAERGLEFRDSTNATRWKVGLDDIQPIQNDFSIRQVDDATPELIVTTSGNVGIGVATPEVKLAVDGAISGFGIVPIGSIIPWHKSIPGVPPLPDGWVECNGQVLEATGSPLHGQVIPDLNASGRFLRGATESGILQDDMMQNHTHPDAGHYHSFNLSNNGYPDGGGDRTPENYWMEWYRGNNIWKNTNTTYANLQGPSEWGGNSPRVGNETRPVNMSVVWIMRVK